jgi:hypothetical protein
MRLLTSAKTRAIARDPKSPPGEVQDYVSSLDGLLFRRDEFPIILHTRVSARSQDCNGNLDDEVLRCLEELTKRNLVVTDITREIASGWMRDERVALSKSVLQAQKYNAVIVAESLCRFLRSESFHTKGAPNASPTALDFEWLAHFTHGIPLATILPPNTKWQVVRSYQTIRGIQHANGPGYMKQRREIIRPHVLKLARLGLSLRDIERKISVSYTTIRDWLRNE